MTEIRAFLAHAKADGDDVITDMLARAGNALREISKGRTVVVTAGRDDYAWHFARCGSWEAWARDVAQGVDYLTREPRYHTIIVPTKRVGAATANIVRMALAAAKPVLRLSGEDLTKVSTVVQVAERDFKTGWSLQ